MSSDESLVNIIPARDNISSYVYIGQPYLIAIAIASDVLESIATISLVIPFLQ